jgi:flavin-dependent dehydrogenase
MKPDILVIGGGPAGSAAAIQLAGAGLRVRLYEKKRFPRPKLCGGFLSPESLIDLEQLGVMQQVLDAGAQPVRRTIISAPSSAIATAPLPAPGLSLSRELLDSILLEQAQRAGVDVRQGADGSGRESEADWIVVATGRQPPRRAAQAARMQGPFYYGIQTFFDDVPGVSDQVELDLVPGGYVGLVRHEGGKVNLCALTTRNIFAQSGSSLDVALDIWKTHNPLLRERLRGARRVADWQSIGPVRLGMGRLSAPRRLFTGDAAYVVDPFAGEGIAMALQSAAILGNIFRRSSVQLEAAYEAAWRSRFQSGLRFHRLTRSVLNSRRLQEAVVQGMRTFPRLLTWLTKKTRPEIHAKPSHPDLSAV